MARRCSGYRNLQVFPERVRLHKAHETHQPDDEKCRVKKCQSIARGDARGEPYGIEPPVLN
jgi:hypothetical protein